jgi:hypothetical protein
LLFRETESTVSAKNPGLVARSQPQLLSSAIVSRNGCKTSEKFRAVALVSPVSVFHETAIPICLYVPSPLFFSLDNYKMRVSPDIPNETSTSNA